jgi:sugar (pentulose or hexulose) kinase
MLAGALNTPVSVMETAGEGGPWGMALLAQFMQNKSEGQKLEDYLSESVFAGTKGSMEKPDAEDVAGFNRFLKDYVSALTVEKTAVTAINMIKES